MHPEDPNILFVPNYFGVHKTVDGGLTWTQVIGYPNSHFTDIEFKPGDPTIMYASNDEGVFKSTDTGETWFDTDDINVRSSTERIELAVTPANPEFLYVLVGGVWGSASNSGFNGLYLSEDSGDSFRRQSNSPKYFKSRIRWIWNKKIKHGMTWLL